MSHLSDFLDFVLPPATGNNHFLIMTPWTERRPGPAMGKEFKKHVAAKTHDELEKLIAYSAAKGKDVWIAVQSYDQPTAVPITVGSSWFNKVKRKAENVEGIRVLFSDLDVKHGAYSSVDDAVAAIIGMCTAIAMPLPSLYVLSGNGVHVYWRLDTVLTHQQWKVLAFALANAEKQHGILADHQVTVDAARVLRPPSTFNYKDPANPKPVTMTQPGATYPLAAIQAALAPFAGPQLVTTPAGPASLGPAPTLGHAPSKALAGAFTAGVGEATKVDLFEIAGAGCEVFANSIDTAGASDGQALWALIALASTFDIDPTGSFHDMSRGHPGYDPALTDQKLAEKQALGIGWPGCIQFETAGGACLKCAHRGKIKSPLNLMKTVVQTAQLVALGNSLSNLPNPYYQLANGHVMLSGYEKGKNGEKGEKAELEVIPHPVGQGYLVEDTEELAFNVKLGAYGDRLITVPKGIASPQKVAEALHLQGCYIDKIHYERVQALTVAWVTNLQRTKGSTVRKRRFGWDGDEFNFGGKTFTATGDVPAVMDEETRQLTAYQPVGDLKPWKDMAAFLMAQNNPALECITAAAFAGPILELSGSRSTLLAAYSNGSGVGKSTAMILAQAVWGHPVTAMNGLGDTANALMKKVGAIRNLTMFWDEIKTKGELDKLVVTTFQLAQGREKARLSSNSAPMALNAFNTMMVAAANDSLADLIAMATETTGAGILRVFEINVPLTPRNPATSFIDVNLMAKKLETNHGQAGLVYAAHIAKHRTAIMASLKATTNWVVTKTNATGDERFWITTIATLLVGAQEAAKAGLVTFNVPAMAAFLVDQLNRLRDLKATSIRDMSHPEHLISLVNEMLRSCDKNVMTTNDMAYQGRNPLITLHGMTMEALSRKDNLWIQHAPPIGVVRVVEREFKRWLREQNQEPRAIVDALRRYGAILPGRGTLAAIGAGVTTYVPRGGREWCLEINLNPLIKLAP